MVIREIYNPVMRRQEYEVVAQVVPTTQQVVATSDIHLLTLHLVGSDSGTATIVDGNGNNVIPPAQAVGTTSGDYQRNYSGGRHCPNGIKWQASDGSIVGYARWY